MPRLLRWWLPALLVSALAAVPRPGTAAPVTWTLSGVTFDSHVIGDPPVPIGGSFAYDAATDLYSDWAITVTGLYFSFFVTGPLTPANSSLGGTSATRLAISYSLTRGQFSDPEFLDADGFFLLNFAAPLDPAGSPLAIASGTWSMEWFLKDDFGTDGGIGGQDFRAGSVIAALPPVGVPAPPALAVFAVALGGLILVGAGRRARS